MPRSIATCASAWFTLETLTATIARSRTDASTGKVVERIVRSELVVVDDIELLPAGADEAEALYRLVDAAYEKRSLIVTSNLHPARFDSIFPKGLVTAAVDRSSTPTSSSSTANPISSGRHWMAAVWHPSTPAGPDPLRYSRQPCEGG